MDIKEYWQAVLRQDAPAIREYFWEDAYICWHNTDERFTVEEFIRANCEYPGQWDGEVKRLVQDGDQIAVAVRVWTEDGASSFHAVSFLGENLCHRRVLGRGRGAAPVEEGKADWDAHWGRVWG